MTPDDPVPQQETPPVPQDPPQPADAPAAEPVEDAETPAEPRPDLGHLKPTIEALLFAVGEPLTTKRIADALDAKDVDGRAVRGLLNELKNEYDELGRGFSLEEIAGGFQLLSRAEHAEAVGRLTRSRDDSKFSQAALETLAIIAYKQPIGRAEIENIRGVQAGPLLRALLDRRLIKIVGREDVPGRPFLYGTTRQFLERMGLKGLSDLPKVEDIQRETKE